MQRLRGWLAARRVDLAALAGLGLLALGVFAPVLRADAVLFERDIAGYWFPLVETLVRSLAEGTWPVWNPYFSFGLPMWADPQYHVAYPIAWLNVALMPATYYKVFAVLHCSSAAAGLYVLARMLGLRPLPAVVGAAVWGSCGPLLSAVSLFHIYAGASWMAWVLVALIRAMEKKTAGAAFALGSVAAMQVVAASGEPPVQRVLVGSSPVAARFLRADRDVAVPLERRVAHAPLRGTRAAFRSDLPRGDHAGPRAARRAGPA
jgi:hypothetical protein